MNIIFSSIAWNEYISWQNKDKKIVKKINELIKSIIRDGNNGIGKTEPLKHNLTTYWSKRIDEEHRLVYRIIENNIEIIACEGHYNFNSK